jgi:hypothetical protein
VLAIHDKQARWVPALDMNRIALIGMITGLLAAVITSPAVLRVRRGRICPAGQLRADR